MIKEDKIIKDQAVLREHELAFRRKREPKFPQKEGNLIVGSIFDCNRKSFSRALKTYDERLYVGWNPLKREGRGCWEVWHRPKLKTPVLRYHDEDSGMKIYTTEYLPNDFENWVADIEFLSYSFLSRIREMDAWSNKQLISEHDYQLDEHGRKLRQEEEDSIKQAVKNNKQAFRDLLDYTQSGYNPLDFFTKKS